MSYQHLFLGHGRAHQRTLASDSYWNELKKIGKEKVNYTFADIDPDVDPHIVADLKKLPWGSLADATYDAVVDVSGLALHFVYEGPYDKNISEPYLKEINRVLKLGGKFYYRNGYVYCKTN